MGHDRRSRRPPYAGLQRRRGDSGGQFHHSRCADETQTTPVAVPFDWLEDYSLGDGTAIGYEAAATATAANGRNSVWECYVLGLDPTNAASLFMATIAIGADGTPVIGFEPTRPTHTPAAWYRVEGRRELGSGGWGEVTGESRFFRVVVDVPSE